jgi:hypothetical protein
MKVHARTCKGCGKSNGCDVHEFGSYWHLRCLLKERKRRAKCLTDADWAKVFEVRCRGKQGRTVSSEEQDLCQTAYKSDVERYRKMQREVFNATVPFGSSARMK